MLWSSNTSLGLSGDFLSYDGVAVNSDVLEERVRDEGVSRQLLEEINLLFLRCFFEIKVKLIRFALLVQLADLLLERLDEELLGFLAHDFDFRGDPLVHLLLSFSGVFSFDFLGDLADLGFGPHFVLWLIYFLVAILFSICQLVLDVRLSLLAFSELDEEVSEASVAEEPLLGFLRVLVHGISDHDEVNRSARDHLLDIFFLEVVTQNDGQDS